MSELTLAITTLAYVGLGAVAVAALTTVLLAVMMIRDKEKKRK